ncbi:MAG: oligosaccharide flippase family protein, partial [Gammaproteobacteria bacterium]
MRLARQLVNLLREDLHPDTERGKMVRSAAMTASMNIGATLLAFGASLLYARALGPHDYGLYAYVIAWTAVLGVPAGLGLPRYLVREGVKLPQSTQWLCRWADRKIMIAGLMTAILLASAALIPAAAGARWLFVIAAPLPLLNNLGSVRRALLQAHGWIARSQWPFLILSPALMLVIFMFLWLLQGRLYPIELVIVLVIATLPSLLANQIQLRRAAPDSDNPPQSTIGIRAALPFMWLGGLYLLNNRVDLIMLGSLKGARDAGIYAVAYRAAALVPLIAAAANMALAPRIVRLYQAKDHLRLQQMITAAARRVLI